MPFLYPALALALGALQLVSTPPPPKAGERTGVATSATAAIRDAGQRDALRFTVWYPTHTATAETPLAIGPPAAPLFQEAGRVEDAPVSGGRLPTLLLSHGNGGTARMMGWLGTALARAGYLVIAVDHPGNNGIDPMTLAGSVLPWLRADDLATALAAVQADPVLGAHVDATRLGLVGYSAGGFTALVAAGARPDMPRLARFCAAHPDDGVCRPQDESPTHTQAARLAAAAAPELAPHVRQAGQSRALPGVRAAFLLAPAIVQAFDPAELEALPLPLSIMVGTDDAVAAPASNSDVAAALAGNAVLHHLPGVAHYDFLSECTPLGASRLQALCHTRVPKAATHAAAVDEALRFFGENLR